MGRSRSAPRPPSSSAPPPFVRRGAATRSGSLRQPPMRRRKATGCGPCASTRRNRRQPSLEPIQEQERDSLASLKTRARASRPSNIKYQSTPRSSREVLYTCLYSIRRTLAPTSLRSRYTRVVGVRKCTPQHESHMLRQTGGDPADNMSPSHARNSHGAPKFRPCSLSVTCNLPCVACDCFNV